MPSTNESQPFCSSCSGISLFGKIVSGELPSEPVVSLKTGRVYEKRLLEKYLDEQGLEPNTGHGLSKDDVVALQPNPPAVKPRPPTLTSIPALLSTFQNEWDALVLETFTLKQQYQQVRQELSQALYQNDAACRVVARLIKERDEARQALTSLQAQASYAETKPIPASNGQSGASDAMEVDASAHKPESGMESTSPSDQNDEETYYAKAAETAKVLNKARIKRETPPGLVSAEAWKSATQGSVVESLHSSTKPGILTLCVDKSGTLALTGGVDNHAEIYSRENDQTLATLKGHTKKITSALWVNGGGMDQQIVTASADKSIRIWSPKPANAEEGKDVKSIGWTKTHIIKAYAAEVVGLSLHPCNRYFASASADGSWAIHSLGGITICEGKIDSPISQIAYHPDGLFLGIGTSDGFAKIVDVRQKQVLATLDAASSLEYKPITGLHFSENGYYFATTSAHEVAVWDLRKQKKTHSWTLADLAQQGGESLPEPASFADARFDYSGKYIVLASDKLYVYNVKGWQLLAALSGSDCFSAVSWVGNNAEEILAASLDSMLLSFAPSK
ncbi:hypothetical protein GGI07_004324 [Coemansia sp. Benny D115]|nr:hypothetical protein GGI07_004324 [Coemansia sp. Benny D115]